MSTTTTETTGAAAQGEGAAAPVKTKTVLDGDVLAWRQAYLDAQAAEKEWADMKDTARKHLEAALGDTEEGVDTDGQVVVRWSWVKSNRLDQKKLKEQAPELVASCMVESVARRFTIPTGGE